MKENIIQIKSYHFAIKIIQLYKALSTEKKEFVLSKQLLRSGTAIGANIEEAIGGQSRNDFFAKLSIAYKEARETAYWIKLLRDTNYITEKDALPFLQDCQEIIKIIGKIQITMRNNNNKKITNP